MNLQPKSALCFGKDNASGGLYSGGQLAAFDPASNRYSLVGIYSFGQERCTSNEATVFTRVDKYLKWIVTKIQEGECRGGGGGGTLDKKKDS